MYVATLNSHIFVIFNVSKVVGKIRHRIVAYISYLLKTFEHRTRCIHIEHYAKNQMLECYETLINLLSIVKTH